MQLRHLALTLLLAACGTVAPKQGSTDGGTDHPPADGHVATGDAPVAPPDGMPEALDRSCAEVKARLATSTDGRYWIDPDLAGTSYKPFQVWCGEMATATPHEYLELARTSQPADTTPASNFSTYAMGAPHASWTCNCGVATTLYSKVRIDPTTLTISSATSFAVYSSSTNVSCLQTMSGCPGISPFAAAGSCITNYDTSGRANVDLRDLPFHVAGTGTAMFKKYEDFGANLGFTSAGTATIDSTRKVVTITGGGDCGGFGALTGLVLAQDL